MSRYLPVTILVPRLVHTRMPWFRWLFALVVGIAGTQSPAAENPARQAVVAAGNANAETVRPAPLRDVAAPATRFKGIRAAYDGLKKAGERREAAR